MRGGRSTKGVDGRPTRGVTGIARHGHTIPGGLAQVGEGVGGRRGALWLLMLGGRLGGAWLLRLRGGRGHGAALEVVEVRLTLRAAAGDLDGVVRRRVVQVHLRMRGRKGGPKALGSVSVRRLADKEQAQGALTALPNASP